MRPLTRRPSAGLVVACLALFVALSGTSFADGVQVVPRNSVGTPQLKRNAVTTPKLRNGSVTLEKLAANARIPGPVGPSGPAGPKGDTGDAGAPWATGLERVSNASGLDSLTQKTVVASCPQGKRALGGGGTVGPPSLGVALVRSFPASDLSGWQAVALEINPTASNWGLTTYVVCGRVG